MAYYIGWASRPEYQMARFHNAPETKLTNITARIKAIGKTCGRPRLASLSLSTRPTLSRVRHFSCLTFAMQSAHHPQQTLSRTPSSACDLLLLHVAGARWKSQVDELTHLFRYRLNDDISRVVMAAVTEAIPIIDDFAADV